MLSVKQVLYLSFGMIRLPDHWRTIKTIKPINKINKIKITNHLVDFVLPVDYFVKIKESQNTDKYLDLARELIKKTTEQEGDSDANCGCCAWKSS